MKYLISAALLFVTMSSSGQMINTVVPKVKLGTIIGNHLDSGRVVRPQISSAEILAFPYLVVDAPGWKVVEYKCSMLSSDNKYWGPFVIVGSKLDDRIIEHVESADFKKGRMFLENIRLEHDGIKSVTNNIIIDYSN
jgi:hypothetical protein